MPALRRRPILLVSALLAAPLACSETAGTMLGSGRDATVRGDGSPQSGDTAGRSDEDAALDDGSMTTTDGPFDDTGPGPDSGPRADTGRPPPDGGPRRDSGPRPDAGPRPDGAPRPDGSALSATCQELLDCCPQVPMQLQMACMTAAESNNDMQCMQALQLARAVGFCAMRSDAGPAMDAAPRDIGPLGPVCDQLSTCCNELAPLDRVCFNTVDSHDEAACMRTLDLAHQAGRCLGNADGGPRRDAFTFPDLGLSLDGFLRDIQIPDVNFNFDGGHRGD